MIDQPKFCQTVESETLGTWPMAGKRKGLAEGW